MFDFIFWEMVRGWRNKEKEVGYRKHNLWVSMTFDPSDQCIPAFSRLAASERRRVTQRVSFTPEIVWMEL